MWRRINKIGWTIWSWPNFATTIRSIWQQVPPTFKWWRASHQFCLQRRLHMDNPQVMQVKKCRWSHNLMKKGGACGRWPMPTLKRCTNDTKILWTKSNERWIWKREWNVVEHQKIPIARRFEPQVVRPICGSIQGVGKEISQHLQIIITKKS